MPQPENYPRAPDALKHEIYVRIFWYHKHGESLMGEEKLDFLSLYDLQDIFDVYIDNVTLNFWHVKTREARLLQRLISHRININKFIYFVEQKSIS